MSSEPARPTPLVYATSRDELAEVSRAGGVKAMRAYLVALLDEHGEVRISDSALNRNALPEGVRVSDRDEAGSVVVTIDG